MLDPSVTVRAAGVDFYPCSFYQPLICLFLDLKTNTKTERELGQALICLASPTTAATEEAGVPPPELPVPACFCVYLHVLWLFYSIEKKKKPAATVVEYQRLWFTLGH